MLKITPQGVQNLRYDADGNGTFETSITPTVSVTGALASDAEPPTITVSRSGSLDHTLITLTASDNGSGVKAIFYSLDGTHYQAYTKPIQINALQIPAVYVFADDKVANRLSLVTYKLPIQRLYLPIARR